MAEYGNEVPVNRLNMRLQHVLKLQGESQPESTIDESEIGDDEDEINIVSAEEGDEEEISGSEDEIEN